MTSPSVFEQFNGYREGVADNIITQQNLSITKAIASKNRNPAWLCRYPIGDVTYPSFINAGLTTAGATGAQSTGTAHTHTLVSNTGCASTSQWSIPINCAHGGYITCQQNYVMDALTFCVFKVSTSAGGSILLQIFRENPDGSLTIILSDDIKAVVATSTPALIQYNMSNAPIICKAGERYLIRIANLTSPAVTLGITGVSMSTSGNIGYPFIGHLTTTSPLATATSFNVTDANTYRNAGTITPWFECGQNFISYPQDQIWWDDFNRIYLGPDWIQSNNSKTGDMTIVNGKLTYTGTTTGGQEAIYINPTTGAAVRADIDIHDLAANGAVDVYINRSRDPGVNTGVALAMNSVIALIGTTISNVQTVRDSVARISNEGTWSIFYEPTPDKYTALFNGEEIGLDWTDSGHVVPHGPDYQYSSVMIECDSGTPGGTLDNWIFRDWAP